MKNIFILFCLFVAINTHAQEKVQPYDFPVKPGTPEWKFSSPEIMYSTCQIPKDVLSTISTEALVVTCINYPLFGLMNAYNSPQAGFEAVLRRFNGLTELLQRKDAANAIVKVYKSMDPGQLQKSWALLEQGQYAEKFCFIEIILSQNTVLAGMDDATQAELIRQVKLKYSAKNSGIDVFGILGLQSSLLPAAKLLALKGRLAVNGEGIAKYLQSGQTITKDETDAIYAQVKK
jgi:hypothetical protein